MAWETGTATNYSDLLTKIITFLTTNATLVGLGQQWANLGTAMLQVDGAWLRGPGLSGTEEIYVGLQTRIDAPADIYNLEVAGSKGFLPTQSWLWQPGKSPAAYLALWNSSIPYWIIANGRRFIVIAKVSTTYHSLYCGKILTYGYPSEYDYPLFIGAEWYQRWSAISAAYRSFFDPGAPSDNADTGTRLCYPDGSWQTFQNINISVSYETESNMGRQIWPYGGDSGSAAHVRTRCAELRDNIDGSYTLMPIILHADVPSRQVFGELDGCNYVSGFNNASENIITIDGQDYLVVQNIYRTGMNNYMAVKLA